MNYDIFFFMNSILLGVGLAMDAFSISIANGLREPGMKRGRMYLIAGTYAGFQFLMPMIGWTCVHTIVERFSAFQKFIPWIALILLAYIGGKMLIEGIHDLRHPEEENPHSAAGALSFSVLLVQGIATSIDALSTGFTIADYGFDMALVCCLLIAAVTFVICFFGLVFGKRFGEKLAEKASIFGGLILIGIGLEIFIRGVFM